MAAVVADAGGTYLRCAIAGDDGSLQRVSRQRIPSLHTHSDPSAVWEAILELIARYVRDVEEEVASGNAIVFSVPGPVVDGRLVAAPTIIGERSDSIPDIAAMLGARTGRSIRLVNDVSAAAWYLGERIDAERFFVVTVSSGIGGKLFDRRRADRVIDVPAYAGEIGHIVVDAARDAPVCDCRAKGHLGAISSGRGTQRLARHLASVERLQFANSTISQAVAADAISNEAHLIPAALAGDVWALSVIERAAAPLAQILAAVVAANGLERIVVIGGFAQQLGPLYARMLSAALAKSLDAKFFEGFGEQSVCVWHDDEEVCLAGAAALSRPQVS